MSKNHLGLTVVSLAFALVMATTASASTLTCESKDNARKQCNISGDGSVRLDKQLSKTKCVEDDTWGRNMEGIWVDRGCRGQFVFTPSEASGQYEDESSSGSTFGAGQIVTIAGAKSEDLDAVSLTDGPGRGGVVGRVGNGRLMTVDNCDGDWCHVRTTTGASTAGWIAKRYLRAN